MTNISHTIFYLILNSLLTIIFLILTISEMNLINMIMFLIIYSILICLILMYWAKSAIFSIILFLTLISGLLIIFLYFISLISNMTNKYNLSIFITLSMLLNIILLMLLMNNKIFNHQYTSFFNFNSHEISPLIQLNEKFFYNILNIYFYPFTSLTLLSMFFLLLVLFSIIKMCSIKSSTLRKIS